jgi:uncharacterized membrane-anchored protein
MTRLSLKLLVGVVVFQILFFAGWAVREEMRFLPGAGESILVRTVPVDPRDLLSGQYMALRYEFSRRDGFEGGREVWVVLREYEGFFVPRLFLPVRPAEIDPGEVVIRGRVVNSSSFEFGIERYFVPEGTPTPPGNSITVRLRIGDDYFPRIEQVYVKGKPWPDYNSGKPWAF